MTSTRCDHAWGMPEKVAVLDRSTRLIIKSQCVLCFRSRVTVHRDPDGLIVDFVAEYEDDEGRVDSMGFAL